MDYNETTTYNPVLLKLFPLIHYPDYNAAIGQMKEAARFHKMCRIIGHPGAGKTTLLKEFLGINEQACFVSPPKGCRTKDLLALMGKPLGYHGSNGTICNATRDMIAFLNQRGPDTVFLIDESDNLVSKGKIDHIDRLDTLRYIWDHTRLHTSFIFAAPYDLEVRLQKSSEQISNSQFYRRCSIHQLRGMPQEVAREFLHCIEKEFHVAFDTIALNLLLKRITAVENGGLGITAEILEKCLRLVLPQWCDYYTAIEQDVEREYALHIFAENNVAPISRDLVENAMATAR